MGFGCRDHRRFQQDEFCLEAVISPQRTWTDALTRHVWAMLRRRESVSQRGPRGASLWPLHVHLLSGVPRAAQAYTWGAEPLIMRRNLLFTGALGFTLGCTLL